MPVRSPREMLRLLVEAGACEIDGPSTYSARDGYCRFCEQLTAHTRECPVPAILAYVYAEERPRR